MADKNENLITEIAVRNKFYDPFSFYNYLPDPDPILRKRGEDIKIYRELTTDTQISACYQSRKAGVLSKEWSIDRGKAKTSNAKIIEQLFKDIDIDQLISDILEAPFYGFQPLEIMWELNNGLILPKQIIAKPQEWFRFNSDNQLVLKPKSGIAEELPLYKFLCPVVNGSYLNPYGEKVLARCFWSVLFKKGGLKFWVYFTEKYGMPIVIGKIEAGQDQNEIEAFADKLNAMVQDAVIVINGDKTIEFQESTDKAGSAEVYEKLIAYCDASISKAILGQTLTTEVGSSGSYAASKTHFEVRQDIVESDKKLAEKTVNKLIDWIYELNWKGTSDKPVFSLWEEEDIDKDLAERDKTLADTGVKFTKKYFMKNYGLEEEDFEIAETPVNTTQFSEPVQDELTKLIESIDDKTMQRQVEDVLQPVMDLIRNAKDPMSAMDTLAETYPNMETKQLEELLTKLIFISEIFGRIQANAGE